MIVLRLYKLIHANAMQYKIKHAIILLTGSCNLSLKKKDKHDLGRKQPALFDRDRLLLCYVSNFIF